MNLSTLIEQYKVREKDLLRWAGATKFPIDSAALRLRAGDLNKVIKDLEQLASVEQPITTNKCQTPKSTENEP